MRLLKRSKIGLLHLIFSRTGLMLLLILMQIALLWLMYRWSEQYLAEVFGVMFAFEIVMLLYLINCRMDASAKITWLVLIMIVPLFGTLFLLFTRLDVGHRAMRSRLHELIGDTRDAIAQDAETAEKIGADCPEMLALSKYFSLSGCMPAYRGTDTRYYPSGEAMFEDMLAQIELAEKFIFLEYFIVEEGHMWGRILEKLAEKSRAGVQVRVMYDGTNEFTRMPRSYPARLKELGIECKVFAPLAPFLSTHYNYRDHRKILVIDGHTAFTGGVNIADEYINRKNPFGYWKDTGLMLKGPAVASLTLLFLQMWNVDEKKPQYSPYLECADESPDVSGYVMPYGSSPLEECKEGEMVYMDILSRAERYVHIMTPYLILDGELETALRFAAQRGVDVRIILPGIPDKKAPYALAMTHYISLIKAGVKIYEFTPGFIHAKSFVSDDTKAVVGTINLDYRSLYHHFECAVYMHGTDCIKDVELDFQQTLKQSRLISLEAARKEKKLLRLVGVLEKAIASMM